MLPGGELLVFVEQETGEIASKLYLSVVCVGYNARGAVAGTLGAAVSGWPALSLKPSTAFIVFFQRFWLRILAWW